jgi:hypothetical protein
LVFVPPPFHLPPDQEKSRYLTHQNSLDNPGYVAMFAEKIRLVQTWCPGARTVLDYGCGPVPVLATLLRQNGFAADAYDPTFFPETKLRNAYDLIISTETFEHFRWPRAEWDRLRSLMAPAGFLAVMTRFLPCPGGGTDTAVFRDWYYKNDPTHIIFYSPATFRRLAESSGLAIVYADEKDFVILRSSPATVYDAEKRG